MLAIDLKRGVESTLERVFKQSGNEFGKLKFIWSGRSAAISSTNNGNVVDATVFFPAIDESKPVGLPLYNELIAYAIHELGHAWFTDTKVWNDEAAGKSFLFSLINGLEDPRIEQKVIDSGYAPNSKALFNSLLASVLAEGGYVQPDDFCNIPFVLAVEGRRLNGYQIAYESILPASPWQADLTWALHAAQSAKDTAEIVKIAVELDKRLNNQQQEQQQQQQDGQDDQDGQAGSEQSDKPDGKRSGKGIQREVEPSSHIADKINSTVGCVDELLERPSVRPPVDVDIIWSST
jgi:hypothetical protein